MVYILLYINVDIFISIIKFVNICLYTLSFSLLYWSCGTCLSDT